MVSDVVVVGWTVIWLFIGTAVHAAIDTIAAVGRQVESGAVGIAANLNTAGNRADDIPLVGGALRSPLDAAGRAALDLAGAGAELDATASWLAWVLAAAVAAPPILAIVVPWLILRIRFVRRKLTVLALAVTPEGTQLLALRALANRPLGRLTAITPDPVTAWRVGDPEAVAEMARLELRAAGVR